MPSFVTFSPGLPPNVPATVLPVFGPPIVEPLGVWLLLVSIDTKSSGMAKVLPCIAGKSAQKVGPILLLSYLPLYAHLIILRMYGKVHILVPGTQTPSNVIQ